MNKQMRRVFAGLLLLLFVFTLSCLTEQSIAADLGASLKQSTTDPFGFSARDGPQFRLPAELTVIEEDAFASTAVSYLMLPESLASVGEGAFSQIPTLTAVYIPEATTYIGNGAFSGAGELTVYGVAGSYAQAWADENGLRFRDLAPCADSESTRVSSLHLMICALVLAGVLEPETRKRRKFVHSADQGSFINPKERAALRVLELSFP